MATMPFQARVIVIIASLRLRMSFLLCQVDHGGGRIETNDVVLIIQERRYGR